MGDNFPGMPASKRNGNPAFNLSTFKDGKDFTFPKDLKLYYKTSTGKFVMLTLLNLKHEKNVENTGRRRIFSTFLHCYELTAVFYNTS